MHNDELAHRFDTLTTAHIADGCIRAGVAVRCAPASLSSVTPGARLAGRVLPAQHVGSVDIFLDAFERAHAGDVLVVDNAGRLDEACVGDLVVLEARAAGVVGLVIWGLHRDTGDIREIALPVFSLGSVPTGPLSVSPRATDALETARVGEWMLGADDLVFADDDGVLFVPADHVADVLRHAETIRDTERGQADLIRHGVTLREQVDFAGFRAAREANPGLSFREHLRAVGGAIEV